MKAVIQRVSRAGITIDGKQGGEMSRGFVILLGVMKGDTLLEVNTLAEKLAGLRVFTDEQDKMNLSLNDVGGDILLVSNFTLGADCRKGRRPSFDKSMPPAVAEPLYEAFVEKMRTLCGGTVYTGKFGADMEVSLVNDGPVTILLDTDDLVKHA